MNNVFTTNSQSSPQFYVDNHDSQYRTDLCEGRSGEVVEAVIGWTVVLPPVI